MIDILKEKMIKLADLPARLNVSTKTPYRWADECGLETVQLGGLRYTSEEALVRFAAEGKHSRKKVVQSRIDPVRQKEIDAAVARAEILLKEWEK